MQGVKMRSRTALRMFTMIIDWLNPFQPKKIAKMRVNLGGIILGQKCVNLPDPINFCVKRAFFRENIRFICLNLCSKQ